MSRTPRILILEDDDTFRQIMAKALRERGYEVCEVAAGLEAVQRASEEAFDLVVTDIRMAGMDGLDALAEVKRSQPLVRSLVVTGYSNEDDSIRAIRLGVDDFLKKPFRLNLFVDAVRSALGKKVPKPEAKVRRSPAWGARWWALYLESQRPESKGSVARLESLLEQVKGPLGLSQARENAVAAALFLFLGQNLGKEPAPEFIIEELEEEARSAWHALHNHEKGTLACEIWARLSAAGDPEELAAGILAALDWAPPDDQEEPDGALKKRGLLALARALAGRGESESAQQALEQAQALGAGPEAGPALLELARLEAPGEKRRRRLREALEAAAQLGPLSRCRMLLEAALLSPPEEAGESLEEARSLVANLQLPGLQALIHLALHLGVGRPQELGRWVAILVDPRFHAELSQGAPWLLRACLRQDQPELLELERRLLLEFPHLVPAALGGGELKREVRLRLAQGLNSEETWCRAAAAILARDQDAEISRLAHRALDPTDEQPQMGKLHLLSFGNFKASIGGRQLDNWRTKKTRWMLARLASRPGQLLTLGQLVEDFWPGEERLGRQSVLSAVSHLRRALKKAGGAGEFVLKSNEGFRLNPELVAYNDVDEVETILKARPEGDAALGAWRRLSMLLAGPYLDDCYMDWAQARRSGLERQALEALLRLAALCQQKELFEESLEHLGKALVIDPYSEAAVQGSLLAYRQLGRGTEAVRMFESYQRSLQRDLELEPPLELLRLYHTLRLAL